MSPWINPSEPGVSRSGTRPGADVDGLMLCLNFFESVLRAMAPLARVALRVGNSDAGEGTAGSGCSGIPWCHACSGEGVSNVVVCQKSCCALPLVDSPLP